MFTQNNEEKKLDWMYKGTSSTADREEYLLGRSVDKTLEELDSKEKQGLNPLIQPKNHVEHECIPPSIRDFKKLQLGEQVDLAQKLQEDPLIAIKKREEETRQKLLQNPVQLKKIQRIIRTKSGEDKQIDSSSPDKLTITLLAKYTKVKHKLGNSPISVEDNIDRMLARKILLLKKKYPSVTLDTILNLFSDTEDDENEKKIIRKRKYTETSDPQPQKKRNIRKSAGNKFKNRRNSHSSNESWSKKRIKRKQSSKDKQYDDGSSDSSTSSSSSSTSSSSSSTSSSISSTSSSSSSTSSSSSSTSSSSSSTSSSSSSTDITPAEIEQRRRKIRRLLDHVKKQKKIRSKGVTDSSDADRKKRKNKIVRYVRSDGGTRSKTKMAKRKSCDDTDSSDGERKIRKKKNDAERKKNSDRFSRSDSGISSNAGKVKKNKRKFSGDSDSSDAEREKQKKKYDVDKKKIKDIYIVRSGAERRKNSGDFSRPDSGIRINVSKVKKDKRRFSGDSGSTYGERNMRKKENYADKKKMKDTYTDSSNAERKKYSDGLARSDSNAAKVKSYKRKYSSDTDSSDVIVVSDNDTISKTVNIKMEIKNTCSDNSNAERKKQREKNYGFARSESDTDNSDSERKNLKKNYGLVRSDGTKIIQIKYSERPGQTSTEEKSNKTEIETKAQFRSPRKRLTEEEIEKLRKEMMQNAEWRDTERVKNVNKYKTEDREELKSQDYNTEFIRKELLKSANSSTVESRIKSNINNIQRSGRAMNSHFSRR